MRLVLALPLAGLLLVNLSLHAQQNNPFSLKWRQINTPHFNVLFPSGYELQGQRMANTLEHIHAPASASIGGRTQRISVLLQNQSAVSNGFVTLAPWRSEFFGMPPQDYNFIGTNEWLNLLAVHEFRHVAQFANSRVGVNKLVYFLFGQQGLAVSSFVAAPQWFWEGDAVVTETAFTHSGRGRIPSFNLLFRTNMQEGRVFNYNKQLLRSYKHNIPDHYVLGYNMISYLRNKTGQADVWGKIAGRAWRTFFIPFTFSRAIKKETGLNVRQLYREMAASQLERWSAESSSLQITPFETITTRKSTAYTDYLYPQVLEDGTVVALKKGIGDIEQLVVLVAGKEGRLFVLGPVNASGQLSAEAERVVWNEMRYDPRWRIKNYSVVRAFDLQTGKARQLSRQSRYAGAALSPDGSKVATVETNTGYETQLVVLDYATGSVVTKFPNPQNAAVSMPRWADNESIVALITASNKKTMSRFNLTTGTSTPVMGPSDENVGYPVPFRNYVFYNSPVSGIDNIYVIDQQSGNRFQVTSSKYGAYNPAVSKNGEWIYYNEQTKNGFDVVRISFDSASWKPLTEVLPYVDQYNQQLVQQEGFPDVLNDVGDKQHTVRPYRKISGMLNPHSWGPYINSSLSAINVGIASRDLLNTTVLDVGYQLDLNERTGSWSATASYQGFYPIIDFTFSQGERKATNSYGVNGEVRNATFRWREQSIKPTLRIPFLLTNSKYNRELTLENSLNLTRATNFVNDVDGVGRVLSIGNQQLTFFSQLDEGMLVTNEFRFQFNNLLKRSRRDIQSRWGQRLEINVIGALANSDFNAGLTSATGYLFFPGFFKHHSFYTIGAYQKNKINYYPDNYFLRNTIPKPRGGFSYPTNEDFYFGSANYTLPLWYPDLALGPFVNVQRVRSNFFFDYGLGETSVTNVNANVNSSQTYYSSGVEVRFDGNLMRLVGQFDLGFRFSYQLTEQKPYFEMLIGGFGF